MSTGGAAITIVKPYSARLETLVILAAAVLLAAVTVGFARANAREDRNPPIEDWQASSFTDLGLVDRGNYSSLRFAGEIIQVWYADSYALQQPHWMTVEELSDEETGLEPFMRDASWRQGGEVQWQLVTAYDLDGATVYFGNGGKAPGQSAYLLVISHFHKGASFTDNTVIWIHRNPNVTAPATFNVDSLVRSGWKQVVPYSGADEVKRLRGTD